MTFQTLKFASIEFNDPWDRRLIEASSGIVEYKALADGDSPAITIVTEQGEKHKLQFGWDTAVLVIGDVVHIPPQLED